MEKIDEKIIKRFPSLKDDEKLVGVFRPSFLKLVVLNLYFFLVVALFLSIYLVITYSTKSLIWYGIAMGAALVIFMVWAVVDYKTIYYAYTTERIIERKGLFKAKEKYCFYEFISTPIVGYSKLDKLFKRNFGTVYFEYSTNLQSKTNSENFIEFKNLKNPHKVVDEIEKFAKTAGLAFRKRKK